MKDSYEKAISAYQKVLKTDPGHRKTYKDLGIAYFGRGDIEKALACLKKALDLGLMSVDIYYHLGLIYKIMGFGDTAIFNFKKALKGNSSLFQLALIYSKLGRLYFEKGFLDEAFHTLKKSYQINPRDLDTCLNLAFVYDEKELLEDAISMYNQAFCLNTSLAVSWSSSAYLGRHSQIQRVHRPQSFRHRRRRQSPTHRWRPRTECPPGWE